MRDPATLTRARTLRANGASYRRIARALTDEGYATLRGGKWQANTIARIIKRAAEKWAAEDFELDIRRGAPPEGQLVYFIQVGRRGPVKIGETRRVAARLAKLQEGNPCRLGLRAWMHGDNHTERMLHLRFDYLWLTGEWFACRGELRAALRQRP